MGRIRNADQARSIRAAITQGSRDGKRTYDPGGYYYQHHFLNTSLMFQQAYRRAYNASNKRLIASMTDYQRATARQKYRKAVMPYDQYEHEELVHEVAKLRKETQELRRDLNKYKTVSIYIPEK